MPLRRPARGRGEAHDDARAREHGEDRADDRRLADAGPAGDDERLPARRLLDRAPLLGRELDPRLRSRSAAMASATPSRGCAAAPPRARRGARRAAPRPRASPRRTRRAPRRPARARRAPSRTHASSARSMRPRTSSSSPSSPSIRAASVVTSRCGGPDVPRFGEVVHHLEDAGLHPLRRVGEDADRRRDAVGGLEADAAHVEREPVGLARDDVHRVRPVPAHDARREGRARAVRLQEDHHVAERALLAPRAREGRAALVAEAVDLARGGRCLPRARAARRGRRSRRCAARASGPTPLMSPDARYFSRPASVSGASSMSDSTRSCSPCFVSCSRSPRTRTRAPTGVGGKLPTTARRSDRPATASLMTR